MEIIRRKGLGATSVKGICAASKTGIDWFRDDADCYPEDGWYVRWGCTSSLPHNKVINTAKAIHEVSDKLSFRLQCAEKGISPETWTNMHDFIQDNKGLRDENGFILRPRKHSQGRELYFFPDVDSAVVDIMRYWLEKDFYISRFIPKVAEYRVAIVQGRVIWVAKKTPGNPESKAWNVAQGGRFDNVRWGDWDLNAIRKARDAFYLSSLDFGGVDVMVDAGGNCFVLEINSAPSLTSPYRQKCFAMAFDHIVETGSKIRYKLPSDGTYGDFIHPALTVKGI